VEKGWERIRQVLRERPAFNPEALARLSAPERRLRRAASEIQSVAEGVDEETGKALQRLAEALLRIAEDLERR